MSGIKECFGERKIEDGTKRFPGGFCLYTTGTSLVEKKIFYTLLIEMQNGI
jgi:hypothetical protein